MKGYATYFMCIFTIYSYHGTNFTMDYGNYKFILGNVEEEDLESCKRSSGGDF